MKTLIEYQEAVEKHQAYVVSGKVGNRKNIGRNNGQNSKFVENCKCTRTSMNPKCKKYEEKDTKVLPNQIN